MSGGWVGGGRDLPGDWARRRRARFELDAWRCVDCGHHDPTGATLECDHVGAPNDHRLEQLRTRCGPRARNCHGKRTARQAADARAARSRRRPTSERHPGVK